MPRALTRAERDGRGDHHRVGEVVGERHRAERDGGARGQLHVRGSAEPFVDLAGRLDRQRQARHVEERPVRRLRRLGVERRLAPPAGRADDHRRVRSAQDERGNVDHVRHRHAGAAGDREMDFECRCQRGEEDQEKEG